METWATCPAVERHPFTVSGAWVFKGTRVPVSALRHHPAEHQAAGRRERGKR